MVRRIVATLVRAGRGEIDAADVTALLRPAPRSAVHGTAPAHGLTLLQVEYLISRLDTISNARHRR